MHDSPEQLGILGLLIGIFAFATIPYVLAKIGGWAKLAQYYSWTGEPVAKEWRRWQSARFNLCQYNNALSIGTSERGLFFKMIYVFKMGHPPLYIPWQDISTSDTTRFFFPVTVFTVRKEPTVKVTLFGPIAKKILAARPAMYAELKR